MTETFPYKPKPWVMLLVVLFFGPLAVFMAFEALGNDRGLVLNGIIRFGPQGATIVYALVALVCASAVVAGLAGFWSGITSKATLTITPEGISVPPGLFRKTPKSARFGSVTALQRSKVKQEEFLNVKHAGGKLTISKSMFAKKADFERCVGLIAAHVQAAQSGRGNPTA